MKAFLIGFSTLGSLAWIQFYLWDRYDFDLIDVIFKALVFILICSFTIGLASLSCFIVGDLILEIIK